MFHLFTHAMFKALLFLGAGSVIHAVHTNEMSQMGGLRKYMPLTHITFLIACLAIAGIYPFSGFFSKDEILSATYEFSPWLGAGMTLIAGMTAFYMFRLYFGIFWGKEHKQHHTPHESPVLITFPLIFLAILTVFAGFIPFGKFVTNDKLPYEIHIDPVIAGISIGVSLLFIGLATMMYRKESRLPDQIANAVSGLFKAAYKRFYIDEIYLFVTKKIIFKLISAPTGWVDKHIVGGTMDGFASVSQWTSYRIRNLQNGKIQFYSFMIFLGTLVLIALALFVF
jgi:NADH-quinone oxidoreductase subunit L